VSIPPAYEQDTRNDLKIIAVGTAWGCSDCLVNRVLGLDPVVPVSIPCLGPIDLQVGLLPSSQLYDEEGTK